jgi:hypothetical protein
MPVTSAIRRHAIRKLRRLEPGVYRKQTLDALETGGDTQMKKEITAALRNRIFEGPSASSTLTRYYRSLLSATTNTINFSMRTESVFELLCFWMPYPRFLRVRL